MHISPRTYTVLLWIVISLGTLNFAAPYIADALNASFQLKLEWDSDPLITVLFAGVAGAVLRKVESNRQNGKNDKNGSDPSGGEGG